MRGDGDNVDMDDSFISLQRNESIQSAVTNEEEDQDVGADKKELSNVEKILLQSQASFGVNPDNEDEKITVVQVGERGREYNANNG